MDDPTTAFPTNLNCFSKIPLTIQIAHEPIQLTLYETRNLRNPRKGAEFKASTLFLSPPELSSFCCVKIHETSLGEGKRIRSTLTFNLPHMRRIYFFSPRLYPPQSPFFA